MKKLAIAIIAVFTLTAASAYSQMLSKGTQEFDIEGNYDELGAAGSQIWIGLGYGNFVMDNLEFIVAGAFIHNDYQTGYHPAIGVHYTINLGGKIIPFVGGNLGYGFWNNKDTEDLKGFVYGVEGGVYSSSQKTLPLISLWTPTGDRINFG